MVSDGHRVGIGGWFTQRRQRPVGKGSRDHKRCRSRNAAVENPEGIS